MAPLAAPTAPARKPGKPQPLALLPLFLPNRAILQAQTPQFFAHPTHGGFDMDFTPYLVPGAATMAILAIVYLVFVFWTRRPGRKNDLAARDAVDG